MTIPGYDAWRLQGPPEEPEPVMVPCECCHGNGSTVHTDGRAKTELAAKNALLAAWRDFIARVGLMERIEGCHTTKMNETPRR